MVYPLVASVADRPGATFHGSAADTLQKLGVTNAPSFCNAEWKDNNPEAKPSRADQVTNAERMLRKVVGTIGKYGIGHGDPQETGPQTPNVVTSPSAPQNTRNVAAVHGAA